MVGMRVSSLIVLSILALAGCSTTHPASESTAGSETVLVTYRVKAGKEAQFQSVLARAWEVYQSEHMVYPKPHVITRATESGGTSRYVEIFTWRRSPDHAPDSVKKVWDQEQSLCEARGGHRGIDGGEVELLTAK